MTKKSTKQKQNARTKNTKSLNINTHKKTIQNTKTKTTITNKSIEKQQQHNKTNLT